jgi:hypothetical protein
VKHLRPEDVAVSHHYRYVRRESLKLGQELRTSWLQWGQNRDPGAEGSFFHRRGCQLPTPPLGPIGLRDDADDLMTSSLQTQEGR